MEHAQGKTAHPNHILPEWRDSKRFVFWLISLYEPRGCGCGKPDFQLHSHFCCLEHSPLCPWRWPGVSCAQVDCLSIPCLSVTPVTQPHAPPLFKRTFRRSVYSVRGQGAIINGHDRFVSHFHRICQSVWKHQTLGCLGWGICHELCSPTCLPDWLWLRGSSGAGRFCVLSTWLTPGPSEAGVEFKACFVNVQSSPWYGDKRTQLTHQRGSQVSHRLGGELQVPRAPEPSTAEMRTHEGRTAWFRAQGPGGPSGRRAASQVGLGKAAYTVGRSPRFAERPPRAESWEDSCTQSPVFCLEAQPRCRRCDLARGRLSVPRCPLGMGLQGCCLVGLLWD